MKKILHRCTGELIHEYVETEPINFSGLDLQWANLEGAVLTEANLEGSDLRAANLKGANLKGADLTEASLRGADLFGADLCRAHLRGADLKGADLLGAGLTEADLTGAKLTGANLRGVNLRGVNLRWANLTGVNGIEVLTIEQEPYNILCFKFLQVNLVQIGCEIHSFDYFLENYKAMMQDHGWLDERVKEYLEHKPEMEEFFGGEGIK